MNVTSADGGTHVRPYAYQCVLCIRKKRKEKKRTRHVVTTYLFQVNGIKKIINFIFILNFFVGKILLFYFKSTDFRLYFVFTMHFCRFFR